MSPRDAPERAGGHERMWLRRLTDGIALLERYTPAMLGCALDPNLQRHEVGDFKFPLGVYPVSKMTPKTGYTIHFEPADSDSGPSTPLEVNEQGEPIAADDDDEVAGPGLFQQGGEWEPWPERFVFDVVISSERLEPFCRMLFAMLPDRIYPIIDFLGHDAFREVDPYMAYEQVPLDVFTDGVARFRDFFFEDGMCGFGAMCETPFLYFFVDEHKIVTIRVEPSFKERIERLLAAFDLSQITDPAGADSASHEHRTVLTAPSERDDLLSAEEILERLRDRWNLMLNVDPEGNVDDEGKELGTTLWRVVVRVDSFKFDESNSVFKPADFDRALSRYAHVFVQADNLNLAEQVAQDEVEKLVARIKAPSPQRARKSGKKKANGGTATEGPEREQSGNAAGGADAAGSSGSSSSSGSSGSSGGFNPDAQREHILEVVTAVRLDIDRVEQFLGRKLPKGDRRHPGSVIRSEWIDN